MKILVFALVPALALSQDTNCPAYPQAERTELNRSIELDQLAFQYAANVRKMKAGRIANASARVNFIDNRIFDKMDQDRVVAAPASGDSEFLRRVSVHLSGRIPTVERAKNFLADASPDKRAKLIEELLTSTAYNDQWTLFFSNRFQVTSGYYSYIGLQGRNLFHKFLRDFITRDRSYKDVVTEMLTASGDADANGPANFLVRAWQDGDPLQDTWDTATDRVTTRILGIKTECVSCHDGRNHLEQINVYMAQRKRQEFYGMSAFMSRLTYQRLNVDGFGQPFPLLPGGPSKRARIRRRWIPTIRVLGRLANGGPYTPKWMFTGETPKSNEWRGDLARILTNDRQFARATVNYLWAAMFNYGLVDPADGWDLARLDPANPPKDWPTQLLHAQLLDELADYFIANNYSVKAVLRQIANSSAYQLSSKYDGQWRPEFVRYFAKHQPRRLAAEEMWDAIGIATDTLTPMTVFGFDDPLYSRESTAGSDGAAQPRQRGQFHEPVRTRRLVDGGAQH